jgi:hypothetical protein
MANDSLGMLLVTVIYSRESGRSYGAAGLVSVEPFVTNPGYATPPTAVLYNFTAPDEFRTPSLGRTDLGINYRRRLPGTVHGELLAAFNVLNVLNSTVEWHPEQFVRVQTAFTNPSLQRFNPFVRDAGRRNPLDDGSGGCHAVHHHASDRIDSLWESGFNHAVELDSCRRIRRLCNGAPRCGRRSRSRKSLRRRRLLLLPRTRASGGTLVRSPNPS